MLSEKNRVFKKRILIILAITLCVLGIVYICLLFIPDSDYEWAEMREGGYLSYSDKSNITLVRIDEDVFRNYSDYFSFHKKSSKKIIIPFLRREFHISTERR